MNKNLSVALGTVMCLAAQTAASAATLTGTLTVDDAFNAYISTSDSGAGTLVATGSTWENPQTFSYGLTPGTTYYLHVDGWDTKGDASGFLGSFSLSGTGFAFSNGVQTLNTNTSDWKASLSGFSGGYVAPDNLGTNGTADPWYLYAQFPQIDSSAQWIWTGTQGQNGVHSYFSTTIVAVPEPETYAMMMAGLAMMGFIVRHRQKSTS
jgi:MSHA biogenesis protein MshQ